MDKRKGILGGVKKLGPVNRLLFFGFLISFLLNIIFFLVPLFTGATKKGQKEAKIDSDIKHKKEMSQLTNIDSKIDIKTRPFIGVERFSIDRNNNSFTPLDSVTIYLRNYGDIPANNVNIYFDIYDEADLRRKVEKFPFRNTVIGNFVIMPGDTLKIEDKSLNTGVILDKDEYEKWAENIELAQMNERLRYYKEHDKFPRQDIVYVILEIKYRGLEEVRELPFSLRAVYSPKLENNEIVWTSNNSEAR